MEPPDLTVGMSDSLWDLESELHNCDALLFSRAETAIGDLLFDCTDKRIDEEDDSDDMLRCTFFDTDCAPTDGASRAHSDSTTPPMGMSVAYDAHAAAVGGARSPYGSSRPGGYEQINYTPYSASPPPYAASLYSNCYESSQQEHNRGAYGSMVYAHGRLQGGTACSEHDAHATVGEWRQHKRTVSRTVGAGSYEEQSSNMREAALQAPRLQVVEPAVMEYAPRVTALRAKTGVHMAPAPSNVPCSTRNADVVTRAPSAVMAPLSATRHMHVSGAAHGRIQSGRFVCAICGKTFKRGHNLKIHQRLHNGESPYAFWCSAGAQ
ncbi:unnamed protein product [Agarophyton chilense]